MEISRLALPAGFRLDSYEIVRELGKGGFGITYQARDMQIGRMVAIKELLPDSIATRVQGNTVIPHSHAHEENWQWARERFVDEARMLAGFRHPNIVAVHRILEANGTVYLVMDCIEGESYESRLNRIGKEPDEISLRRVIEPLIDGLQEVHAAGLLHRDIKPENILFDKRGNPILIDFGAARSTVGATMMMTSIVTHGYSPIEQYQTKGKMGPWTDIYALGAVMCRAITGEKPPVAADRVLEDDFKWVSYRNPGRFGASFLASVDWALRIRVEERPQNIDLWVAGFVDLASEASKEPKVENETDSGADKESSVRRSNVSSSFYEIPSHGDEVVKRPKIWGQRILLAGLAMLVLALCGVGFSAWKHRAEAQKVAEVETARKAAEITRATEIQRKAKEEAEKNARLQAEEEVARIAAQRDARHAQAMQAAAMKLAEEKKKQEELVLEEVRKQEERDRPLRATRERPFVNSLGMSFVPISTSGMLASQFETTGEDFRKFTSEAGIRGRSVGSSDYPVSNITKDEAKAFCEWLSKKESRVYRLPTIAEWGAMVGLMNVEQPGKVGNSKKGEELLPPMNFGNYALMLRVDDFPGVAPVGSFPPTMDGLYDVGGNVWEWCDAPSEGANQKDAARGASWYDFEPNRIDPSFVAYAAPGSRSDTVGFRCVLELSRSQPKAGLSSNPQINTQPLQ